MEAPKNNKVDNIIDGIAQVAPTIDTILAINGYPVPFTSIFSSYLQGFKPFNKNVESYLKYVSEQLNYLLQNGIEVQDKILSEEYISYLYISLEGLKKNHQHEKLGMFNKSFYNYWMTPIAYDVKTIYIDLITNLSLSHIHILKSINESTIDNLFTVETKRELYNLLGVDSLSIDLDSFRFLLIDLENKNLISISSSIGDDINVQFSQSLSVGSKNKDKPRIVLTGFAKGFVEYLVNE